MPKEHPDEEIDAMYRNELSQASRSWHAQPMDASLAPSRRGSTWIFAAEVGLAGALAAAVVLVFVARNPQPNHTPAVAASPTPSPFATATATPSTPSPTPTAAALPTPLPITTSTPNPGILTVTPDTTSASALHGSSQCTIGLGNLGDSDGNASQNISGWIDWGDGSNKMTDAINLAPTSSGGANFHVSTGCHTYAHAGTYTISVLIQDGDGASPVTDTRKIVVT
jgi:hypothetical protein